MKWGPIHEVRKAARVAYGEYQCEGFQRSEHVVKASVVIDGKRHNNALVDHRSPVIDPEKGFSTWDEVIARLFVEQEALQVLCKECHDVKTQDERSKRK